MAACCFQVLNEVALNEISLDKVALNKVALNKVAVGVVVELEEAKRLTAIFHRWLLSFFAFIGTTAVPLEPYRVWVTPRSLLCVTKMRRCALLIVSFLFDSTLIISVLQNAQTPSTIQKLEEK
jgi:hypothetical protein